MEITSELDLEGGRWVEAGDSRKRELYGRIHRSVRRGGVASDPQTILWLDYKCMTKKNRRKMLAVSARPVWSWKKFGLSSADDRELWVALGRGKHGHMWRVPAA